MSRIRTFVAVELSPDVAGHCRDLIKRLSKVETEVHWVDPKSIHLTLKFLGDVLDREVHEVCRAVEKACAGMDAFDFSCGGVGAFPSLERPRTIWLGIRQGSDKLAELSERVEHELHLIGYPKERRRFSPHITIGKIRDGGVPEPALIEALQRLANFDGGECDVSEVTVFSSELRREGPLYTPLSHAGLKESYRKKKEDDDEEEEDEDSDPELDEGEDDDDWNSLDDMDEDDEEEEEEDGKK